MATRKGRGFLDHSGQPVRKAGINLDITQRKQTEEARRESEQRYKEVFDITSDSTFLVDITSDGRFKFAGFNAACEKTVGFPALRHPADLSKTYWTKRWPKKSPRTIGVVWKRERSSTTKRNCISEAGQGYFHTSLIPVRNAEGRLHRIIGVAQRHH